MKEQIKYTVTRTMYFFNLHFPNAIIIIIAADDKSNNKFSTDGREGRSATRLKHPPKILPIINLLNDTLICKRFPVQSMRKKSIKMLTVIKTSI